MGRRRRTAEAAKRRVDKRAPKNVDARGYQLDYVEHEKKNEMFEKFYKEQGFMTDEEFELFMKSLREPLPTTFRLAGFKGQSEELMKLLQSEYFSKLLGQTDGDTEMVPPIQLPWYPDGLAWQINFGRKEIRQSEVLKELKQFLISETETGNISRQEAVSMIPPLVLDVQPHHRVLDMCAAPGSKTAQLIEMLQKNGDQQDADAGFVIANDADNKRCYLMCHQVRRLESTKFAVINHDAQLLPGMKYSTPDGPKLLRFDRILADVPCTGDGTFRKNVDAWQKWNAAAGHALNPVQRRVLKRGLELLEVGGRLVYSTCSMNPVEDEAVLATVLLQDGFANRVKLVDISDQLPGLKYLQGRKTWKVMTRAGEFYESFSDVPEKVQSFIRPHAFPPKAEDADALHLERCIRILPHMQNTGGFFVAVLEKVNVEDIAEETVNESKLMEADDTTADAKSTHEPDGNSTTAKLSNETDDNATTAMSTNETDESSTNTTSATETNNDSSTVTAKNTDKSSKVRQPGRTENQRLFRDPDNPPPLKKQKLQGFKEDPFIFLTGEEELWPPIRDFYQWGDSFPVGLLMARSNEGKKRNLYFVSTAIKDLVLLNGDHVKFINLGMKILNRSVSKYCVCDYRLVQEGIESIERYCGSRTVNVAASDLILLLKHENPFRGKFTKDVQNSLDKLEQGSVLLLYKPTDGDGSANNYPSITLRVCGWLGVVTMRTFLSKHEREHILRLFHEEIKDPEKSVSMKAINAEAVSPVEIVPDEEDSEELQTKASDEDLPGKSELDGKNGDEKLIETSDSGQVLAETDSLLVN